MKIIAILALLLLSASPAFAWSSINDCISDMGGGDPNAIVHVPPSVVGGNEPLQRADQWCRSHTESGYRQSELNKAGLGFLIIVLAFSPAGILTLCRRAHRRTMMQHTADMGRWAVWNSKDERFRKAQMASLVVAVIGLNAWVFGGLLFH